MWIQVLPLAFTERRSIGAGPVEGTHPTEWAGKEHQGPNYIDHYYIGHNCIDHNCMGHNYLNGPAKSVKTQGPRSMLGRATSLPSTVKSLSPPRNASQAY